MIKYGVTRVPLNLTTLLTKHLVLPFRIQQLEKDLYYYKKTSRDLKRKLREVLAGQLPVSSDLKRKLCKVLVG